jgi:hypothetical protein
MKHELRLAEIITRYLRGQVAGEVFRMDSGAELVIPCYVVRGENRGGNRAREILVVVGYEYQDEAGSSRPSDQASAAIQEAEDALRDYGALAEFISTLPIEERTGWQIVHHWYPPPEDVQRDGDGENKLQTAIQFTLRI